MKIPSLNKIDHVHVYTKNRNKAQQWYSEVLGFSVVEKYHAWAADGGPLVMTNSNHKIEIALFERDNFTPSSVIAFGVSGEQFIEWKHYLADLDLLESCKDHDLSWSLYFKDQDKNSLEITSYEHEYITHQNTN